MASQNEPKLEEAMQCLLEIAQERTRFSGRLNPNLKEAHLAVKYFETLEHLMDEFRAKFRHSIITMRRSYNEQLPISRLPVELFINITHLAVHGDPALHYTTLYKLVGVSSRWASLINSSSSLWSIIHARHTSQLQATALARSGTSLLSLIDDVVSVPGKLAFLANILPYVYRWRSLEYGGNRAVSDYYLNDLVDAPAPKLESLNIDVLRGLNVKVDLFRGEAPRLQHLGLSGCPIPWESGMLSGLKTLKLMYLGTLGPSVDQVIGILLASLALVNLVLGSLFERSQDIVNSNSRTVELPDLRSLSLTGLSSVAIALLLQSLHAPHCANLRLYIQADRSDLQVAAMREIAPIARRILLTEGSHPRIEVLPRHILARDKDRGTKMEIGVELSEDLTTELAESIVSAFQLPENNEFARVTVSVPCVTVSRSMVIPILRNSLSVWRLVLQSMDLLQPREPDVVLEFLAKPVVLGGVTRWPAPKLKVLVLGSSPDNLLDMVIRRYGRAGDAGEPGQSVERPLPLRVLQILSPITIATGPLVEELTRILGEGVVLWEESRGVRLDPADLDDWEGSGAKAFDGEISDNPFGSSGM